MSSTPSNPKPQSQTAAGGTSSAVGEVEPELRPQVTSPKVKPVVLGVTGVFIALVAGWALFFTESAEATLGVLVGWIGNWFGWFYILLATAILVFVVVLALRYSKIRLGKDTDRPEYSTFAWASMLFAAGIGTDVMFFAVAEPASQYLAPPVTEAGSLDAAREGTVWTLFHYGITGWGMYTLMGIALGYFAHRTGLPLAVRSALYPLFGKRIKGGIGNAVDIATVLGTIFGVATSLGIGVVMLNVGLDIMFGIDQGTPAQVGLVVVAVLVAIVSATSGVDKGIRILSQLNVVLALVLAGWVLVFGDTAFLLRAATMNVGDFISMFPGLTLDTMAYDHPAEWMNLWTLFFWAWWVAWASFVGMFLARISKGRTLGQFVIGTLTIPFIYILMWVTMFGNTAIARIRSGDTAFAEAAVDTPESGFYMLLQQFPGAFFLVGLATFVGLLFYVTSADSGALVMANLTSRLPDAETDAKPWVRILWAVATGVLTIAMLVVGGITALQYATVVMGLPFAIVMILVAIGLLRALEGERKQTHAMMDSLRSQVVGAGGVVGSGAGAGAAGGAGAGSWRNRLRRQFGNVSLRSTQERMSEVVIPALEEVAAELREQGVDAQITREDDVSKKIKHSVSLTVQGTHEMLENFDYTAQIRQIKAATYGTRMREADDVSSQLEVKVPGGGTYDILDYSRERIAHDVLDHYTWWLNSNVAVTEETKVGE